MRKYVYLFLLPALFLISCGDDNDNTNTDTTVQKPRDSFKEGVMKLQRNGFLDAFKGQNIDSITEVYRKDTANGMKQLLIDAGVMLHINVALEQGSVTRTIHEVYQTISDSIGSRYPDLKAEEVKHTYLPEEPGGKDTGWVLLEQKFGEQWYSRKLYYFDNWPIDNFVYRMYNTLLADRNDNTRLHLVEFFDHGQHDGEDYYDDFMHDLDITRMGLLRLTKAQEDTILSIPELEVEPVMEFSVFTTKQTEEMIEKFRTTGLISAANEKWYNDTICQDIRWNSLYKQEDFMDFVDVFFATLMFDTLNPFDPYEQMLLSLEMGSRGHFKPSGRNDEAIGQSHMRTVRFTLNGKVYERDLATQNGIMSPYIFDMVNEALAEQNAGGAFYSVQTQGDVVLAIFLEDDEVDRVISSGFFKSVEKGAPTELLIIYGAEPKAF